MYRIFTIFILIVALAGCKGASWDDSSSVSSPLANVQNTPAEEIRQPSKISFSVGNAAVKVHLPNHWEYYKTAYGLVMTEQISTIASNGEIDGLLTHVFVPPLENLPIRISESNRALSIMREIVSDPEYVGAAQVSQPQSFTWDGFDAAYFLMSNGSSNRTLVLGVFVPGLGGLIACNISAPVTDSERIRAELPQLLEGLEINGAVLSSDSLKQLPEVLPFPELEPAH